MVRTRSFSSPWTIFSALIVFVLGWIAFDAYGATSNPDRLRLSMKFNQAVAFCIDQCVDQKKYPLGISFRPDFSGYDCVCKTLPPVIKKKPEYEVRGYESPVGG